MLKVIKDKDLKIIKKILFKKKLKRIINKKI